MTATLLAWCATWAAALGGDWPPPVTLADLNAFPSHGVIMANWSRCQDVRNRLACRAKDLPQPQGLEAWRVAAALAPVQEAWEALYDAAALPHGRLLPHGFRFCLTDSGDGGGLTVGSPSRRRPRQFGIALCRLSDYGRPPQKGGRPWR